MNHNHSQGMGKHMLLMLICCLVPIALVAAISVFGFALGPLQSLLPYVAALMCPLMMIFMMRGMGHDHGAHDAHQHHTTAQIKEPTPSKQLVDPKTQVEQKSCH